MECTYIALRHGSEARAGEPAGIDLRVRLVKGVMGEPAGILKLKGEPAGVSTGDPAGSWKGEPAGVWKGLLKA
jgi:hypothetical protein